MKIRKRIPSSQLINDSGGLVRPGWMLAGLCLAGAAEAIGPPFEVFYPPSAEPFGAGWSLARFLASSWAAVLVLFMLGGGILGDLKGRRRVLLWSLVVLLVADIALLFSPNTLWHALWRLPANLSAGLIFRRIRASLVYAPEDFPLNDETEDEGVIKDGGMPELCNQDALNLLN